MHGPLVGVHFSANNARAGSPPRPLSISGQRGCALGAELLRARGGEAARSGRRGCALGAERLCARGGRTILVYEPTLCFDWLTYCITLFKTGLYAEKIPRETVSWFWDSMVWEKTRRQSVWSQQLDFLVWNSPGTSGLHAPGSWRCRNMQSGRTRQVLSWSVTEAMVASTRHGTEYTVSPLWRVLCMYHSCITHVLFVPGEGEQSCTDFKIHKIPYNSALKMHVKYTKIHDSTYLYMPPRAPPSGGCSGKHVFCLFWMCSNMYLSSSAMYWY